MKKTEIIKEMYGITNEEVMNRIFKLGKDINERTGRDWSYLFFIDILYDRMRDNDMKELIKEYLGHEEKCTFDKALEIIFSLKNNEEMMEILKDYCELNQKVMKK